MPTSDVCPTEDAIHAFLEHMVDPLLPAKSSVRDTPSLSEQQLVAKQVHAVVLLYNYYHRKQHQQLKFEGFEPFCKLAVVQKPTLLSHMKLMQRSKDAELDDVEKQLSLTEKTIMDACDISTSLDASKDVPSIEGWPISKIAVFLIDSKKENCFLQFGSITMGVWSVIEKDVNASSCISEGTEGKHINKKIKVTKKSLTDEVSNEVCFQQIAISAVKEATGFNRSDLIIMGSDVVYSLSKEKTAALFYLMQCTQPNIDDVINIPIKDAIDSLQGPLVMRSSGQWTVTPVVEYFHLLPYARIVSDLLSREVPSNGLQDQNLALGNINISNSKREENPCKPEVHSQDRSHVNSGKVECLGRGRTSIKPPKLKGRSKCSMNGLSANHNSPHTVDMDACSVVFPQSEDKCKTLTTIVQLDNHHKMLNPNLKSDLNGTTGIDIKVEMADPITMPCVIECRGDNASTLKATCGAVPMDQDDNQVDNHTLDTYQSNTQDLDKLRNAILSKSDKLVEMADPMKMPCVIEHQGDNASNLKATCGAVSMDQDNNQVDNHTLDTYQSNTQDLDKFQNTILSKRDKLVEMADTMTMACVTECGGDNAVNLKAICGAIPLNQDDSQVDDHALDTYQSNARDLDKLQNTIASKETILSQTALRVLLSKRDKLTLQQRNIEDQIALCDKKIQTILNGGEDDLAVKIESVVEGCNDACLRNDTQEKSSQHLENQRLPDPIKMKRLSEAVLNKQNSCQELDGICYENNWILPTYRVSPSDDGFQASITVKGMDFEYSSMGEQCSNPCKARESAATQMLTKLRGLTSHSQ